MDPLSNPLDGLSPELYVATLSKIAHADGLHPAERELLDHQAASIVLPDPLMPLSAFLRDSISKAASFPNRRQRRDCESSSRNAVTDLR